MHALSAIVAETDNRVRAVRNDLLKDVSTRIVHYAQRFGMYTLRRRPDGCVSTTSTKSFSEEI